MPLYPSTKKLETATGAALADLNGKLLEAGYPNSKNLTPDIDVSALRVNGSFYTNNNPGLSLPVGVTPWGHLVCVFRSADYGYQRYTPHNTTSTYIRVCDAGAFTEWTRIDNGIPSLTLLWSGAVNGPCPHVVSGEATYLLLGVGSYGDFNALIKIVGSFNARVFGPTFAWDDLGHNKFNAMASPVSGGYSLAIWSPGGNYNNVTLTRLYKVE